MDLQQAAALFSRVSRTGDEDAAYELLRHFQTGYPLERLRELLRADDETVLRAGTWIASELGSDGGAEIIPELVPLLEHHSRFVRFHVVDALLAGATEEDGQAVANVVPLILDADEAVRWKVVNFLARVRYSVLQASLPYLFNERLRAMADWLAADEGRPPLGSVLDELSGEDAAGRLFAAAAAARWAPQMVEPLEVASRSDDDLVSSFALEQLRRWNR